FPGTGLPSNGQLTSLSTTGVTFQLAGYGSSSGNVNNVNLNTATSTTQTLTLATPAQYATLNVLSTSMGQTGSFNMILVFSDGSTDTFSGATVPDWRATGVVPAGNSSTAPFLAGIGASGMGDLLRVPTV